MNMLLPLVWMGGIFWLSSTPDLATELPPLWDFVLRKIGHAAAFGVLAVLWLRALPSGWSAKQRYGVAATIAVLYAMSDEYHQTFTLGRIGTWTDALIDSWGVLIFLGLAKRSKM